MTAYDIIKKPVITEKSEMLRREYNKYTFEVNTKANKIQIKKSLGFKNQETKFPRYHSN